MKTLYLSLFLVLLFNDQLFSQGAYLEEGQSGYGIWAAFSSNEDVSCISGTASYSASGIFGFGISIGRASFKEKLVGYDLNATAVSPFVSVNIFKQDSITPISLSLGGSYQNDSYSSDALSRFNYTMIGKWFSFGGSACGYITLTPYIKLQPSIGVTYTTGKVEVKDNHGNSESSDKSVTTFDVGLSLYSHAGPETIFLISMDSFFDKDNTTFMVGIGLIFSISK